jgi:hypothetical protein
LGDLFPQHLRKEIFMSGATAKQFQEWEKRAKKCSIDELVFICKDCAEAELAMRGWNPEKENYYADQRMTYSAELTRRRKKCK